ncbi:NUDIX hydrolase [Microvirga subterranea]|uniref:8-oxo-dGTP pyrophosphatase MutT (NUDIX family) n=1 Tax=Microvirga subterranea TaxID=186651 RepID=A0A370HUZ1_9HYPH|nr:NUDIX domain-containing protein [Microvirga subterranea]RDI62333.1 8-oxo-dGTP pyrophosphatase MutT (NUDIX family) [Microvirga subterranea]
MSGLPPRDTARGLVLDPAGRLLLIAYEASRDVDPARPGLRRFWFTPGGGLEPGETHEAALVRELEEEIGVAGTVPGPWIGRRETDLTLFRRVVFARERYFPVRLPSAAVDTARLAETENDPVLDVRWWSLDALEAADEVVEPRGIIGLARRVLAGELPSLPIVLA